jgi:hypothetical protein
MRYRKPIGVLNEIKPRPFIKTGALFPENRKLKKEKRGFMKL